MPNPDWVKLTEKHSDRICLGSDMETKFERIGPELQRYDVFLDLLSEKARQNVCNNTDEKYMVAIKEKCKRQKNRSFRHGIRQK